MKKGGRYLNNGDNKPEKSGKGKKIALIVISVLLVVILGVVAAGFLYVDSFIGKLNIVQVEDKDVEMNEEIEKLMGVYEETEPVRPTEATQATTEPATEATTIATEPKEADILNILVTGQSYREGEDSRLADTLILVTVNKDTKVVTLTSFLRDTYVDLPDYKTHKCGWNKINTCYALGYVWGGTGGAMEMTNMCLELNFGINVDYNVEIDFDVFKKVIDVLGGVRITLTEAEAKYLNENKWDWQEDVTVGENRLFGDYALSYARMRKADGDADSDIKRTARQRNLITAILTKLKSKGISVIEEMANEILPMISTNMTESEIYSCMWELLPILSEITIEQGTCPVEGTYWSEKKDLPDGRLDCLVFERDQQKRLMMPITEGITFD